VSWLTIAAMYFITWWVVLFAVLPFGVRSQDEAGSTQGGTDPGAPVLPRLLAKLIWTTIVATIVFLAIYGLFWSGLVSFDSLVTMFGGPDSLTSSGH
jgi:predicted secreted protein